MFQIDVLARIIWSFQFCDIGDFSLLLEDKYRDRGEPVNTNYIL